MLLGLLVRLLVYPILIGSICIYSLAKHAQIRTPSADKCLTSLDGNASESSKLENPDNFELEGEVQAVLHESTRYNPFTEPQLSALNLISAASFQLTAQAINTDLREQSHNLASLRTRCVFLEGVLQSLESSLGYTSICDSEHVGFDFGCHPRLVRASAAVRNIIVAHEQQSSGLIKRLDEAVSEAALSIRQCELVLNKAFTVPETSTTLRESLITKALTAQDRVNAHLKATLYSQPEDSVQPIIEPSQPSYQPLIDLLQKSPEDWIQLTRHNLVDSHLLAAVSCL